MDLKRLNQHPTITTASTVDALLQPLKQQCNITYFQYLTVYDDNRMSLACNRADWIAFIFQELAKAEEPAVYSSLKGEQLDKINYCFLWDGNLPDKPVGLAREFDIANGLCFVQRHTTYYHLIAVGTSTTDAQAIDRYLNHTPDIMQFIHRFQAEQTSLIRAVDDASFDLAPHQLDENLEQMLIAKNHCKQYQLSFNGIRSYITQQERQCLTFLAQGCTYKMIGQNLGISSRTVESYLSRVKDRLGLCNKQDLLALFQSLS